MLQHAANYVAKLPRWACLSLGCALLLAPVLLGAWREAAVPDFMVDPSRVELNELWLGPLATACALDAADFQLGDLEDCTADLALTDEVKPAGLEPVQLPTTLTRPFALFKALRARGLASKAIDQGKPLLIGAKVPSQFFAASRTAPLPKVVFRDFPGAFVCYGGRCFDSLSEHPVVALRGDESTMLTPYTELWLVVPESVYLKGLRMSSGLVITTLDTSALGRPNSASWAAALSSDAVQFLLVFAAAALLMAVFFGEYVAFSAYALGCLSQVVYQSGWCGLDAGAVYDHGMDSGHLVLLAGSCAVALSSVYFARALVTSRGLWQQGAFAAALFAPVVWALEQWSEGSYDKFNTVLTVNALAALVLPAGTMAGQALWLGYQRRQRALGQEAAAAEKGPLGYTVAAGLALVACHLPALLALLARFDPGKTYDLNKFSALASLPLLAVLAADAGLRRRRRHSDGNRYAMLKSKRDATREMIQMVAHDTRKPFSLMRTGMAILKRVKTVAELDQVVSSLVFEVERSIRLVNAMLEDIMTVSSEPTLATDTVSVHSVISICLHRVFSAQPEAEAELSYDFTHDLALNIDATKILRVLTSLVENALRATNGQCRLWFKTSEQTAQGASWVILTVGNSGNFIPPEKRAQIFDAYFVEGHASGASLSLAVARKFVELHHGTISCRSDAQQGTEFVIKLPTAGRDAHRTLGTSEPFLPAHSRETRQRLEWAKGEGAAASGEALTTREIAAHAQIRAVTAAIKRPLRILLLDDEPIYTAALAALLDQVSEPLDHELGPVLEVVAVTNPTDTMKALAAGAVDLAIVDVDLGSLSFDGLTLAKRYKQQGLMHMVCVHSNRSFPADYKRAIEGGADSFLPKPMSRSHLFEVVLAAATIAKAFQSRLYQQELPEPWRRRQTIVVVDDDIFVREAWALTLAPKPCLTFVDGASLLAWIKGNSAEVKKVGCFVLDVYFDGKPEGLELAAKVRSLCPVPILLSSDASIDLAQYPAIDAIIPKEPMELESLLLHIDKALNKAV